MLATDRSHYAKCNPYMDSPQSIGKLWIFEDVTFLLIYTIIFVNKNRPRHTFIYYYLASLNFMP